MMNELSDLDRRRILNRLDCLLAPELKETRLRASGMSGPALHALGCALERVNAAFKEYTAACNDVDAILRLGSAVAFPLSGEKRAPSVAVDERPTLIAGLHEHDQCDAHAALGRQAEARAKLASMSSDLVNYF